jgi:hypothetical protein
MDPAETVVTTPTTPDNGTYPTTPQHIAMSADYMLVDEINTGFSTPGARSLVAVKLSDASTANVASTTQYVSGAGKFAADGSNVAFIDPSGTPEVEALDTNSDAPRVLTVDVPSTVTAGGDPATFEVAASAPLSTCTIVIKSGDTVERSLDCSSAVGDGVVTWDGKDTGGDPLAAGAYSWTVTGANGAMDLLAYDGTDDPITGTLHVVTATTTSATWPASITYGKAFDVGATVTSDGGTPAGTVTLKSGSTTLASDTLSGGSATLHVSGTKLTPGNRTLTLSYPGSDTLGASSTSKSFTVKKATSNVSATWPASATYGKSFSVKVSVAATGTTPTGPVTLKMGTKTLASHSLSSGKATLSVGGTALKPGSHTLTVAYGGSSKVLADSASHKLTVHKATAHMAETLAAKKVKQTGHAKLTVKVSASGTTPTGTIRVYQGKTRLATVTLTAKDDGRVVITLPKIHKLGDHKIHARYFGSHTVSSVTGDTVTLRVVAP